jgi:hypothetical protein
MAAYLTVAQFRTRTELPGEDIDYLESAYPGFLGATLEVLTAWINARLFKRYSVPFPAASVPDTVLGWLTTLVTAAAWKKRGADPAGDLGADILKAAEAARAEVTEAADAEAGAFDLPRRQDAEGASGISRGGPLGYSEADPYQWMDRQVEQARGEWP